MTAAARGAAGALGALGRHMVEAAIVGRPVLARLAGDARDAVVSELAAAWEQRGLPGLRDAADHAAAARARPGAGAP